MEERLKNIYYDVKHPAGFSNVKKLWEATNAKYSKAAINKWLSAQDTYSLHKPNRKRFTRSRYYVTAMNNLFQADLCDMRTLKSFNSNYQYILTVIDVFCKKAWALPLKTKGTAEVVKAFSTIFKERKPLFLQTDKGKEFVGQIVQSFLKKLDVKFYTSNNPDTKCSVIERFNRTLKTKMWKYFTHIDDYNYIDALDALIESYNNTVHSAINMCPNDVTIQNQHQVYEYLYSGKGRYKKFSNGHYCKNRYKLGDHVRITREKFVFEKGYESNWSTEIFIVSAIMQDDPIRYKIQDLSNEPIIGTFYAHELQKVIISADTVYKIDKVLATRGSGVSRQLFVKWKGYPEKFNTWIAASNLQ
jgi:transposase InsO family protein